MRRASRLLVSIALLASVLTVAGGLGGAIRPSLVPRAAAAGTGGTTVSVQGSDVTITVNMDLCCLKLSQQGSAQLTQVIQQAAGIWNDAFAKLSYKGCLTLHLAVNAHVLSPYNSNWEPGFDQVNAYLSDGRSKVFDGGPNVDSTNAYTQIIGGNFYLPNMDEQVFAHEIGHIMGLGDDYTDVKDAKGEVTGSTPLPGRAGTIMADHSAPPDQTDVNRIGDLVSKAGTKLPNCPETWTGTMRLSGVTNYQGDVCTQPPVDFTISFTSASDGTVNGTGRFHGPAVICVTKLGSIPSSPSQGTFVIVGKRTGDQLSLGMRGVTGTGFFAPFWPDLHLQWIVPIQGTQAHTVIAGQGMGISPGHVTLTVDLTCSGCNTGSP